ncbi:MAG: RecX family transcriptional regulator [Blautia hydrogenotrophica]
MVDEAIGYVKSYGYVDDQRYARNYLAYRLQTKSRQKLFQELYQRGFLPDCQKPEEVVL